MRIFDITGWTAAGERGQKIEFDINSTPLQLYTDSEIGSGDVMWVQFTQSNSEMVVGISVKFDSEPSYHIGKCVTERTEIPKNKLGENKNRNWTIEKKGRRLKLSCNGVEIFNYDTESSEIWQCRARWSKDYDSFRFRDDDDITKKDTASDLYREYTTGNSILSTINLKWPSCSDQIDAFMHNYELPYSGLLRRVY